METTTHETYTAFAGDAVVAAGELRSLLTVLAETRRALERRTLLVFEDWTGRQVDFDLRGSADEVIRRAAEGRGAEPDGAAARPGRPKLGVVSREVSLLPRHWEWLEAQPNGISAAIRRLVDDARKREPAKERARRALFAASRVLTALAGDREGYEEASRALFAGDREAFRARIASWPADVRAYLERLVDAR